MEKSIPLKEIVGFLPYGLKGYFNKNKCIVTEIDFMYKIISSMNHGSVELKNFKPIVRPLSYLTKPITHNGETFVPSELISKCSITGTTYNFHRINSENVFMLPYEIFQKLHEWHFDVYDWIKDGLAVSINDL